MSNITVFFKRIYKRIKVLFSKYSNMIKALLSNYSKHIKRFFFVSLIIIAAWYWFLFLIKKPPIDTTPALIMVWSSVITVLLALSPDFFNRITKLKWKNFEVELKDTIKKTVAEKTAADDFIFFDGIDDYLFRGGSSFKNLTAIISQANRNSDKPILLTANIQDGKSISIPMLFIYLFFLDVIGNEINLLFINSNKNINTFPEISKNSIIGVISGKKALKILLDRFPSLYLIYNFEFISNIKMEKLTYQNYINEHPLEPGFDFLYSRLRADNFSEGETLTEADVINWFKYDLDRKIIDLDNVESQKGAIKDALKSNRFIILSRDGVFKSVASVCKVAKNISLKTLENIN